MQQWLPTSFCTSEIRSSNLLSTHRSLIFGGKVLFSQSGSHTAACKLLQKCTQGCLAKGWEWCILAAPVLRAEIEVNHNLLSKASAWKLQAFNRLQSFKIVNSTTDLASAIIVQVGRQISTFPFPPNSPPAS